MASSRNFSANVTMNEPSGNRTGFVGDVNPSVRLNCGTSGCGSPRNPADRHSALTVTPSGAELFSVNTDTAETCVALQPWSGRPAIAGCLGHNSPAEFQDYDTCQYRAMRWRVTNVETGDLFHTPSTHAEGRSRRRAYIECPFQEETATSGAVTTNGDSGFSRSPPAEI